MRDGSDVDVDFFVLEDVDIIDECDLANECPEVAELLEPERARRCGITGVIVGGFASPSSWSEQGRCKLLAVAWASSEQAP